MSVSIENIIEDLQLEVLVEGKSDIKLNVSDINRPGLQFAGFYDYFGNKRVQVIGMGEWSFLNAMRQEVREKRVRKYFQFDTPCIVLAKGLKPQEELLKCSKEYGRWLLRTNMQTTRFINKIMNYLDTKLAPETRIHGVLVEIYGLGILITGESGIGKSETALELIKRGHRLVADDAVDIKEIESVLVGKSPYITEGMLEVRGMGIIDVPALYGLSSVLSEKNIDLVIYLEQWKEGRDYDRLGTDDEHIKILNIPVRKMTLPIRPGRNVAVIIEAAAASYRYNLSGKISPVDTINKRIEEYKDDSEE